MGLDGVFRRVPGLLATGLRAKREGEDLSRKREVEEQERQAATERRALEMLLLQTNLDKARAPKAPDYERVEIEGEGGPEYGFVAPGADTVRTGARVPKKPVAPAPRDPVQTALDIERGRIDLERTNRIGRFKPPEPKAPPEPKTPSPPSEGERRGAGLLTVLEKSNARIDAVENGISTGQIALSRGGLLGRFAQSPEAKQYDDDLRHFVASALYVVSGATANPGEVENMVKTIRVNEGDDPATRQVKAQRRKELIDAVRVIAGRAAAPEAPETAAEPAEDAERAAALAAMERGADPAAVKARYKQRTGKDLQ